MTTSYEVRPIEATDVDALRRMFHRLSAETVYRRFFRPVVHPATSALEHLCAVDHGDRDALVAVVGNEIVAVARYDRLGGSDEAEVAVVVQDDLQGQGIGRRLVEQLAALAAARGFEVFTATMLGDNRAAAGLFRAVAHQPQVRFEHGELVARAPLHRPEGGRRGWAAVSA